jgi:predicted amidohydrolase YtcJ
VIVGFGILAALALADAIWSGGPIVTVDDANPSAEAVAVREGRIVAVGARAEVEKLAGPHTRRVDLRGRTLVPGFIDGHGHISGVGFQAVTANLLSPPDGPVTSIAALQQALRDHRASSPAAKEAGVLIGFGYDDSQLAEKRHPTRQELDLVASDVPVLVVHQSGHLGALNTKALERAGIAAATPDPKGGVIRREAGKQEPDGVLEETALFGAMAKVVPPFSRERAVAMLEAGQQLVARYGYTTVQDGRAYPHDVETAMAAADEGRLKIDVVAYPDFLALQQAKKLELMSAPWFHDTTQLPRYRGRFRIGGIKLTLDGSPQGKTAWMTRPYFVPPPGRSADYAGYGVLDDEVVQGVYTQALRSRWQVLTHANGDRAIDQLLASWGAAEAAVPGVDVRPVLIHGQYLREDQVERLAALGILPSLFPMHTFYWGDWHRQSVGGPERAPNISPTGWLVRRGLHFTSHHDAPVAFPDAIRVLDATVNRTTRSGLVLGPAQRVEPIVALKALTLWAAEQYFEEKSKGSIEVGKLADFVVLSGNPLTIERTRLLELKVEETIKEGASVYVREGATDR